MMKWVFWGMIALSVLFGCMNGRIEQVSNAAISESMNAVKLVLTLMGGMCLWSGVINVAEKAGITNKMSKLFYPFTKRLFRGLSKDSPALETISMNMTANMLGLGNAATPLGIKAMQQLEAMAPQKGVASDHMVMLVVINTASIQIIPTTIATLRLAHGSSAPMEILPAILLTSVVSLLVSVFMAKLLAHKKERQFAR